MNNEFKELLNLDIEQIESKSLSSTQKAEIKKYVLARDKVKKRNNVRFLAIAALLSFSIVTTSFMTIPALANQFPIIQNILSYFEDDTLTDTYSDLASIVNQVQSSNEIDIMIENAIYDGTNILLTYAIETETVLGENPISESYLEVKQASGLSATSSIKKINETTYVGVEKVTPHFNGESPEEILIRWEPKIFKNISTNNQFEGDWQFEFTLNKITSNYQALNQTIEEDGITLEMNSLKHSDLSSILQFEYSIEESILKEWPFITIEMIEVKDNLGNKYKIEDNGGVSYDNGTSNERSATIYSIDPNATSITLTPQVYFSKGSGELLEKTTMAPIIVDLK